MLLFCSAHCHVQASSYTGTLAVGLDVEKLQWTDLNSAALCLSVSVLIEPSHVLNLHIRHCYAGTVYERD